MKVIYALSALFGLGLVYWAYSVKFDSLSETELIEFGPLWLLPLAFGCYGLAAEKVISMVEKGDADTIALATMLVMRHTWLFGMVLLFPFLLVPSRKSGVVALGALGFWYAIFLLITKGIWHML